MAEQERGEWARPRPGSEGYRIDALMALALALGSLVIALLYVRTGIYEEYAEPWVWAVGIGLASLPLALRRRYPVPVAIAVSVGFFVILQFGVPDLLIVQICLFTALYTVGAWEQNRTLALWIRIGIPVAVLLWLGINLLIQSADADILPGVSRSGIFSAYATIATIQVVTNLLYFGGAFYFGERSWQSARGRAQLEAQGQELDLERQTSAAQAVALDRIAIARELHDVVAHHVSVMGIQAAAARRSLERDPDRAAEALTVVEDSAHEAVTELRRLVNTLRTPETEDPSSTVGVAQIPTLIAETQRAGTPTTLIVAGDPRPLPLVVDVALYRVVQEALTNVRKHAGRGAEATVRLRFLVDAVEVEIADDGVRVRLAAVSASGPLERVAGRSRGAGLGLRGMRERIGAIGGSVHTGRREGDGFLVRARVPLEPAEAPPSDEPAEAPPSVPSEPAAPEQESAS